MSLESVLHDVEQLNEKEKHTVLEVLQVHFADEDDSLTQEELQEIEARLEHYRLHPETAISLEEMKRRHGL